MMASLFALAVASAAPVPDVEFEVAFTEARPVADGQLAVRLARLSCKANHCTIAVVELPECTSAKAAAPALPEDRFSQVPVVRIYSEASGLSAAMDRTGWLELRTKPGGWTHVFRFQIGRDKDDKPTLLDFSLESTFVDFTKTKYTSRFVAFRGAAERERVCSTRVPSMPKEGLPSIAPASLR